MIKTEELQHIITDKKDTIAFIIGNGIHNYLHCKYKGIYPCKTWKEVLEYLWRHFTKKPLPLFVNCIFENDISNTEFFNLLEIEYLSYIDADIEKKSYLQNLMEFNHGKTYHLKTHNELKYIDNKLVQQMVNEKRHSEIANIKESLDVFIQSISKEFGFKNDSLKDKLDTIACISCVMGDKKMYNFLLEPIKKEIAKSFRAYKYLPEITNIVNKIKNIDAPILTTNYDTVLSESIGIERDDIKSFGSKIKDEWFSYYGNYIDNPTSGFGIWHIHGIHTNHKSISIGNTDYMKNVYFSNLLLPNSDINLVDLTYDNWNGFNSWLNIFFNKDLFVFGLGLNNDETFLRWLFIKRKEYSILSRKNLKSWYITKSSENISCAKRYFLESVGFEIVYIQDWDVLYEKIWE